jgi:hypothetical protein
MAEGPPLQEGTTLLPTQLSESNPPALTKPTAPVAAPATSDDELRYGMLVWAQWAIRNADRYTYTEGAGRSHMVDSAPGSLPQSADCSSFCTGLAKWAGASDPNGLNYSPVGYTGTLLEHCNEVSVAVARLGDLIVYGPGTGDHAVFVMERLPGDDFYVASHGKPGDPSRVLHSQLLAYFDGSARYLRWLA